MADAIAGGEIPPIKVTFEPGRAIVINPPRVGEVVAYFPSNGEGFAGGHRGLASVVNSDSTLAVIDLSGRIVVRPIPIPREIWQANGADHSVACWAYPQD